MKSIFSTEIGLLGIWDSPSMSFIKTPDDGMKYMVGDASFADHMTKGFGAFWGTGGDGTYDIEIRVGPDVSLTQEEQGLVEMKAENLKLVVTGDQVYVGSPEYVGYVEQEGLERKQIERVAELRPGTYSIDVFFLYDAQAMEKYDDMTREQMVAADADPNFDKTGFVVLAKPVDATHQFPTRIELPTLG